MSIHLTPVEFIHAVESARLTAKASSHLDRCSRCREMVADLRASMQLLKWHNADVPAPDDRFWTEFTQTVHGAIQNRRARSGPLGRMLPVTSAWPPLLASLIPALISLLLFVLLVPDPPRGPAISRGIDSLSTVPVPLTNLVEISDDSGAIKFGMLDAEYYLSMEPALYQQLQQELSFLHLHPETLAGYISRYD